MKKLSKEAEAVLVKGLEAAAERVNAGEHPTDAIYKVASELSLPAGHVKLMVQSYNNGRTLGQIRQGESLTEKVADFELADASDVLERMFPSTVKTATERLRETIIDPSYHIPPEYWMKRRDTLAKRAAAQAVEFPPMTQAKVESLRYTEKEVQRTLTKVAGLKRDAHAAKLEKISAGYAAVNALSALKDYFKQPDCLPFSSVRENAILTKGAAARALFKGIATKQLEKQAAVAHPVDWGEEPYSLVVKCIKAAQDYAKAKKTLEETETEATEKSAEILAPFFQAQGKDVIVGSVWEDPSPTKEAGMGHIGLGALLSGASKGLTSKISPKSEEALVNKQVSELASPEHESQLQAIRTRAMLHDLMANDPVIGGYEPDQIVDAFNQISQMAPRVAQQRMMAQSLLRKYLEQASWLDMYDQTQVLGAEKELSRMERVPGQPPPAITEEVT
jgi:hypothetical protein